MLPGRQDGIVHIWDGETGHVVEELEGHYGTAYSAVWNPHQSLLARCVATCDHDRYNASMLIICYGESLCIIFSCGEDRTVRTWWFNPDKPAPPGADSSRS